MINKQYLYVCDYGDGEKSLYDLKLSCDKEDFPENVDVSIELSDYDDSGPELPGESTIATLSDKSSTIVLKLEKDHLGTQTLNLEPGDIDAIACLLDAWNKQHKFKVKTKRFLAEPSN